MRAKARVAWVAAMVMALAAFVPGTSQAAIKPLSFDGITISNGSNPGEDIMPGDDVTVTVNFTINRFAIVLVNGSISGAMTAMLPLQFRVARSGSDSISWNVTVPGTATDGTAMVTVNYIGILDEIKRGQTTTFDIVTEEPEPATFMGSATCIGCHTSRNPEVVNAFQEHGHPFKLNEVMGAAPTYPFSEVPSPPDGFDWDDITYVIGGYGWKARFIGTDGYIITGEEGDTTQYNLVTEGWVAYHAGELRPYDCGTCHTTGYSEEGNQDGLEGIVGTWVDPGVTCEACHGPGSAHAASADSDDITVDTSSALCGNCHVRGTAGEEIPASSDLIKHHEQYNEWLASPHNSTSSAAPECVDCHDPHASVKYDDQAGGEGVKVECTDCHTDKTVGMGMASLDCEDCHMPYVVKSATNIEYTTEDGDTLKQGDIRAHIFAIDPDLDPADFFTEDGSSVALDSNGEAALPLTFVCQRCHREGGTATNAYTVEFLQGVAESIH